MVVVLFSIGLFFFFLLWIMLHCSLYFLSFPLILYQYLMFLLHSSLITPPTPHYVSYNFHIPPHIFQGRSSAEDVFSVAVIPHVVWLYQETQHNFIFKSIMSLPVGPVREWILHLEGCVGVVLMLQYGNAVIMSTLIPVEAGIHVRQTQISPPSHPSNCWDYVWQWRGQEAM